MKTRKPRTGGVARARMFIKAHLYWLNGYPIYAPENGTTSGVHWQPSPRRSDLAPEPIVLSREHLHRASRTFTRLLYRFPYALPKAVDNYDEWVERVPQLIDLCKGPIHHGTEFSPSLYEVDDAYPEQVVRTAKKLAQSQPTLEPLVHALSWTNFLTPNNLPLALAWIDQHKLQLHRVLVNLPNTLHPIDFLLTLWTLVQIEGAHRVEPILNILGDPRSYTVVTDSHDSYLKNFIEALQPTKDKYKRDRSRQLIQADPPVPTLGKKTIEFVQWSIQQPQKTQRAALDLFGLIFPPNILDEWQTWWQQTDRLLHKAKTQVNLLLVRRSKELNRFYRGEAKKLANEIKEHSKTNLSSIETSNLFKHISKLLQSDYPQLIDAALGTLPHVPERSQTRYYRIELLDLWLSTLKKTYQRESLLYSLPIFCEFVSEKDQIERFLECWLNDKPQFAYWDTSHPRETHRLALKAYYKACHTFTVDELKKYDFEDFADLSRYASTIDEVLSLLRIYLENKLDLYINADHIKFLREFELTNEQPPALIQILDQLENKEYKAIKLLAALNQELRDAGWSEFLKNQLLAECGENLLEVSRVLTAVESMGGIVPDFPAKREDIISSPTIAEWYDHVPVQLHPLLSQLAHYFSDAEQIAERVIGKAIPSPRRLRSEIAGIESQLESLDDATLAEAEQRRTEHLTKRLHNLNQRLHNPEPLPEKRVDLLRQKLAHTLERTLLQQWQTDLNNELHRRITRILGIIEIPDLLLQPKQLALLGPISQLNPTMRKLALDLLRLRSGPPPWTLYEHPKNQAYIQKLKSRRINPDPWLNSSVPQFVNGKNNREVMLAFADDPLDIFQMGSHFNTCLSVNDFNFFSVFANAADANKRVLYAYNAKNAQTVSDDNRHSKPSSTNVVGRCLLSLTDRGEILIFHPYCHDRELGFDELVLNFAQDLAHKMKTKVVSQGNVSTLVATEWYDDGPVDLLGVTTCLQDGSAFRKSLSTIDPADLLSRLKAELSTDRISSLMLIRLSNLPEIKNRPELILSLWSAFETASGVPAWDEYQFLYHVQQAGAPEIVYRFYRKKGITRLLHILRNYHYINNFILDLFVTFEPSFALRLLRQSRHKSVRSDEDEYEPRRGFLAKAYKALNRHKRAAQLEKPRAQS